MQRAREDVAWLLAEAARRPPPVDDGVRVFGNIRLRRD